jgi:sigma-B regulation protein RsbU (phosphoserine phosphatase)
VLPVSADRRQVLVGDVGGHGIRAALVTAFLKAIAAPVPGAGPASPGALLEALNQRLCRALKEMPDLLVTFFAIEIDAASRSLVYAGAGHPPVYLLRGADARPLPSEGPGLGFDPESLYAEQVETIAPGDRLVLYTDGIREGIPGDPAGSERAFTRLLLACRAGPDFASDILAGARKLMGRDAFTDDATAIGVTVD